MKVKLSVTTMLFALLTSAAAGASDFRGGLNWSNGWYDLSFAPIATSDSDGRLIGGIACGARDGALFSSSAPLNPPQGSAGASRYGANYLECICSNFSGPIPLGLQFQHTPGTPIPNGIIQHSTLAALTEQFTIPGTSTTVEAPDIVGAFAASSDGNLYYADIYSNPCDYPSYTGEPTGGVMPSNAMLGAGWRSLGSLPTASVLGLAFLPGTQDTSFLFALGNDNTLYYQDFYGDGWASTNLSDVASISYSPYANAIYAMFFSGDVLYYWNYAWYFLPAGGSPCTLNSPTTQDCWMGVGGTNGAYWSASAGPQFFYVDNTDQWAYDDQATALFQSNAAQLGAYSTASPALSVLGPDVAFNPPRVESWQSVFEGGSWAPFGDYYWVITNEYRLYAFQP